MKLIYTDTNATQCYRVTRVTVSHRQRGRGKWLLGGPRLRTFCQGSKDVSTGMRNLNVAQEKITIAVFHQSVSRSFVSCLCLSPTLRQKFRPLRGLYFCKECVMVIHSFIMLYKNSCIYDYSAEALNHYIRCFNWDTQITFLPYITYMYTYMMVKNPNIAIA